MTLPAHVRLSGAAQIQAQAMVALLGTRFPGLVASLQTDAITTLQALPEVKLLLVPEQTVGGDCDRNRVSGSYVPGPPPTLRVALALSARRRAFTALHEFGHHLQKTDVPLGASLMDHTDSALLEEVSCEAFASHVLLPDALVVDLVKTDGVDVLSVRAMYEESSASRRACCVRAAQLLIGGGIVALYDSAGVVQFAASSTEYPPARGTDQSATPLIASALKSRGGLFETDKTFVLYSYGRGKPLYGQACWVGDYIVAIMKQDNVPWKKFAPPRTEQDIERRDRAWFPECPTCGDTFPVTTTTTVCPRCAHPYCPAAHCACTLSR